MVTSLIALSLLIRVDDPTLLVLNKGDDTVWLINTKTGERRAQISTGSNPNEVAVSPNQKIAAISDMGGNGKPAGTTLTLVDIAKGEAPRKITITPNGAPHGIVWLSDDRLIFTSHVSDSICELDVSSGKIVRTLPTEQKGTHLALLTPDKTKLFAVNAFSGTVTGFDFKSGKILKQITAGSRAEGISMSPDGKWLACGNVGADNVSMIDTESLEVKHTIEKTKAPIRTMFTADGKHLAVSCVGSGTVEVFDTKSWKSTASVELKQKPIANPQYGNQWPTPMNFWLLKNGNLMVVLVTSHAVAEIDTKTWKVVRTFDTGPIPDGIAVANG